MVFSIQRFVEDYFSRRTWEDPDQFAVTVANLYVLKRWSAGEAGFLSAIARARTVFFKRNGIRNRREFERLLLKELDRKFLKKKEQLLHETAFQGGLESERRALKSLKRRNIKTLLEKFSAALQSKAVDSFWDSRKSLKLRSKPEAIAQSHLALFMWAVLDGRGVVFREVESGIGYIDLVVLLARTPHLIEVKLLKGKLEGPNQLATYMATESRQEGWLIVLDVRPPSRQSPVQEKFVLPAGVVKVVVVNLNPVAPSRMSR